MTLKEFLLKYCHNTQMISVAEIKGDGVRFNTIHYVYLDDFLEDDARNSVLFDREVVEIFCGRGEVLYINVKGE